VLLDTFIHLATAKVIEELHKATHDEVRLAIDESVITLLGRLDQIEDKLEQQSLGPLRAGLTFARLGLWTQARDEFVRACGIDPSSPVACACLGQALLLAGNDEGRSFISRAIQLNPFRFAEYLPDTHSGVRETAVLWSHTLPSQSARNVKPATKFRDKAINYFLRPSVASVATLSGASGFPIVEWYYAASELSASSRRAITAFDTVSGRVRWAIPVTKAQVILSTPALVVLGKSVDSNRLTILDAATGNQLREVSRGYFDVAIQHVDSALAVMRDYLWRGIPIKDAWRRSAGRTYGILESLPAGMAHEGARYHEHGTACVLGAPVGVEIRNAYAHRHQVFASVMGVRTTCEFVAHAYVTSRHISQE
jgi:hypothetical protein